MTPAGGARHRMEAVAAALRLRRVDRSKPAVAQNFMEFKLISEAEIGKGWEAVQERFDRFADNGLLHCSKFGQCIGMSEQEFAGELFDALARRRNISGDSISKAELYEFWDQIVGTSVDSRVQIFLDIIDKNADGRINEQDLIEIISLSASINKLSKIKEQAEEHAREIMAELDPSNKGYIELEDMKSLLHQALGNSPFRHLLKRHLSLELSTLESSSSSSYPLRRWCRRAHYFLEDNWRHVCLMLTWLSVCAGFFAWKFLQYRHHHHDVFEVMGYCVCVAKGSAETLKLNMALVLLLPVCRSNTITTWFRTRVVPVNDTVNLHEVIAVGAVAGAGVHTISHLACGFPRLKGTEGWTGMVMLVLMVVASTLATPWLRRARLGPMEWLTGHEAFWYSHHCFVLVVYVLLVVHGQFRYLTHVEWYNKSTWMYLAVPMVLYAFERLLRWSNVLQVELLKVAVCPGNMLCLHFSVPQGFQYTSSQYIFVNCPAVSRFQWHPFCITSAPEDNYVSVHINTFGDWTSELKNIFSRVCQQATEDNGDGDSLSRPNFPKVLIEGPHGLTSQDYKKYDIVLLISLGIGVTAMISIIRDIMNNNIKNLESDLESGDTSNNPVSSSFHTRRAYFCWINHEEASFEWFRRVIDEVAEIDMHGTIEFRNYCTSIYEKGEARSAVIAVLQSLKYAKNGVDIISGSRGKTHFATPNLYNVYNRIARKHPNQRVGVFYCGAPVLANELRVLAQDFSRKTTTKFEFHKECF